jgi:tetratricopeptide (TPR) repeat protein
MLDDEGMRSLLAALRSEFRYVYGFRYQAYDSDMVVLARNEPIGRDGLPVWDKLPEKVRLDLGRIGISSTADLLSLMILNPDDVDNLVENVEPNTDDNMFLELHTPRLFYESSMASMDGPQVHRRGVLPLLEQDFSPDLAAQVALSHLRLRNDPTFAREVLAGAAAMGESRAQVIARAELLVRDSPDQWRAAVAMLDAMPTDDGKDYLLHYSRAMIRFAARQEFAAALADIDRAVSIRPRAWQAHRLRLNLLIGMQRWQEARAEADLLLASPWIDYDWRIWSDAAVLAAILENPEQGIEEMTRFFQRNPFAAREWNWMAQTLESTGRSDEARVAGNNRDRILRNEARYNHRLARWHETRGNREQARQLLRQLIADDPDNRLAREDLARVDGR